MSDLYYLCYRSETSSELNPDERSDEVEHILASARRNNSAAKVTGCLLFTHDFFFQVLEGPKEAVCATFKRICNDPRHRAINVLSEGSLERRKFPENWMGFSEYAVPYDALISEIGDAIAESQGNLSYAEAMVILSNVAHLMDPSSDIRATGS
ncbi:BLUF domain-containing protein [Roseibium sp.]|uniref:BLUF domain-containing protein n=1 Tax=Roseibium sp. TaxID=1936156 RepID=UPI003A972E68